jgi:hypothetical protein
MFFGAESPRPQTTVDFCPRPKPESSCGGHSKESKQLVIYS